MLRLIFPFLLIAFGSAIALSAQDAGPSPDPETGPPMTVPGLARIVLAIDPEANLQGNVIEFTVLDVPVVVVADPAAHRMRAMVPIRSAEGIEAAELMRLMQANFDSALDARYAIAKGKLWGVYIHPLSPLQPEQFVSGLAQTVGVAMTYGNTYSGGANVFGGGDSNGLYEDLLRELQKPGQEL